MLSRTKQQKRKSTGWCSLHFVVASVSHCFFLLFRSFPPYCYALSIPISLSLSVYTQLRLSPLAGVVAVISLIAVYYRVSFPVARLLARDGYPV